jgi:hypothetical protein
MDRSGKVLALLFAFVVLVIVGMASSYWWANTVPSRPRGVSREAVFLWAPYVGVPGPRRGWWIVCWKSLGEHIICRESEIDGAAKYEGEFIPYGARSLLAPDSLIIDPVKSRELGVWIDHKNIPLVFLKNGEILIPAAKYEEGRRVIDRDDNK